MADVAAPVLPGETLSAGGDIGGGTKSLTPSGSVDRPDSGKGSSTHGSQTSIGSASKKAGGIPGKKGGEDSGEDTHSVDGQANGTKERRSGKAKDKTKGAESHDESCEHATEPCPNGCGAEVQKRFLQSHVSNDCPKRGTPCDFCGENVQQEDEIEHLKVCVKFPMSCPNGCDAKELAREELVFHSASECPKAIIPCPFTDSGCAFEAERQHMLVHLEASVAEHLEKVGGLVMTNHRRLATQAEKVIDNKLALEAMQGNVGSMDKVNGCQLLWKITSYNEKFADAKAGRRVSLYSPMFLTSRYGYKMAISICPDGDGQGKGKYMSMFMCIIRGEFDALLPWPFAQKVTITVIDQCQDPAARKNIQYVMKPNTCKDNIQFLGRPTHERNPSFGTQMFCPLAQITRGDYIRNNTMFISVQVDNSNMPSIP